MQMRLIFIVMSLSLGCIVTGCTGEKTSPAAGTPKNLSEKPSAEAQAELDKLNFKCTNAAWREEFDRIECQKTRPPNYDTSGEVWAFLEGSKVRLAALGFAAVWNSEKKVYELKTAQPYSGANAAAPRRSL